MSFEQAAAMQEQLHSTCQALARMQQELANKAITAQQHHHEALQQTVATVQHTHERAEQLRNEQARHVEIQGTFHQAIDPKFPTLRSKYMKKAEWLQELEEREAFITSRNQIQSCTLNLPCQVKKAIFMMSNLLQLGQNSNNS